MLMSALNACRARLKAFIRGRTSVRDDARRYLQEVTYQLMKWSSRSKTSPPGCPRGA
jgi:DNA-directed RNA polymerase specialized sigma24 family protein